MKPSGPGVQSAVRVHRAIAEIGHDAWDACAAPTGDPFVGYDFLSILEESGCVGPRTGWAPQHLSVLDEDGAVAGVMPPNSAQPWSRIFSLSRASN